MGFISLQDIIIMAIGIAVLVIWLLIYVSTLKYKDLFESLDENDFHFKDLYFMGYGLLEKFNYDYKTKKNRELRKLLEVLYDEKYADFYLRVIRSQQLSMALLFVVLAFIMYGFTGQIVMLALLLVVAVVIGYYFGTEPQRQIEERSDKLIGEFSEVVSKLALLTDAGMILREAWEEIAYSEEGVIYSEMIRAVEDMNNGLSEIEAVRLFGNRCIIPEIKKFTSTLIQGLSKGNKELSIMLKKQSSEVWEMKRQLVKRKGEQAQSKLLLPMILMFVGILVMIMIPIFTNLGM